MPTDIWEAPRQQIPHRRVVVHKRNGTDATLTFEATAANGSKILMLPLPVTDETYVVHFMTAVHATAEKLTNWRTRTSPAPAARRGRSKDDGDNESANGDPDPPSAPSRRRHARRAQPRRPLDHRRRGTMERGRRRDGIRLYAERM